MSYFRKHNKVAAITEHWVNHPAPGHRKDLFGFVDILACTPEGFLFLQVTAGTGSARIKKIIEERQVQAGAVLAAGGVIEVWGWRRLLKNPNTGEKSQQKWWAMRREIRIDQDGNFYVVDLEDV